MKSSLKLFLVVNIILLIFDIQSFAQDPIDQYPGIPLVIYPARRVQDMIDTHPNSLSQIKQMGVYGTIAPDVFDDPDYLGAFTINGIKILPGYTWGDTTNLQHIIWKYTNSHYTVWEAEGTDSAKGLAKLYHNINTAQFTEGSTKGIWTNNSTISAGTELINGPGYPQNVTYNYSDQIVDYKAEYRMKITQRIPNLPQNISDDIVCKILVTNKFDGDSSGPGEEKTVDSLEVSVSQFLGWNNWVTIPIEYDLSNYKNTTQSLGDSGLRLPRGSAYFVQFKVIWYGLEYLNLYIDKIRVSDEKGRQLVERLLPRSQISTFVNTNINESTIVGWYGTDEPGSIDNYEPYRIVDSVINANSNNLHLYTTFTTGWGGIYGMPYPGFFGDNGWVYRGTEFIKRSKLPYLSLNTYMYNYPWTPEQTPEFYTRNIDEVTFVNEIENPIPDNFTLFQNFPNPFNPTTSIQYAISSRQIITIKIYDVIGKEITTLVNEEQEAGEYEIEFDAQKYKLSSGVYFYTLTISRSDGKKQTITKKMILLSEIEKKQEEEYEKQLWGLAKSGDKVAQIKLTEIIRNKRSPQLNKFLIEEDPIQEQALVRSNGQ